MSRTVLLALLLCVATGCVSTGTVGILAKSRANPLSLVTGAHPFQELGSAHGHACRFFVLAVAPFGDSTLSTAVDDALSRTRGDALLNATVSSSLFGFIPYYNVLSYTCTSVKGIAIRFESSQEKAVP